MMWLVLFLPPLQLPFPLLVQIVRPRKSAVAMKLFLIATTKNLSPWANRNLALERVYCHLLVRGNYLFLPPFLGGVFKRFLSSGLELRVSTRFICLDVVCFTPSWFLHLAILEKGGNPYIE